MNIRPQMTVREKADFRKAVYAIVAAIPIGKVSSYGEIARLASYPGYHRMVGKTLRDVPDSLGLPCHRVVNSRGCLVPGWTQQLELLKAEGIRLKANGCVDMLKYGWRPFDMIDE